MSSWSVVVPSNRPEQLVEFLLAWDELFRRHKARVFVVFDGPRADAPDGAAAWEDIPDWIPRRTDMIRSWGIYGAWLNESDYTLSLDDDVRPEGDPFEAYEQEFERGAVVSRYLDVGAFTTSGKQMRGFPRSDRALQEVAIQYGGWDGMLDYDAETQLAGVPDMAYFAGTAMPVPLRTPITTCAMNMAWRTRYAPWMFQLPLVDGRYNRWGDIWSGLMQKRLCDHTGVAMLINGHASVLHERASDPQRNLELEQPGYEMNEFLWEELDDFVPYGGNIHTDYLLIAERFADLFAKYGSDPAYAEHVLYCSEQWIGLFR